MKRVRPLSSRSLACLLAVAFTLAGWRHASAALLDVITGGDSGPGSLRQAIATSNAAGGTNTIRIWTDSIITLSSGELLITNTVNLVSMNLCIVQANYSTRVFRIADAAVSFTDMEITRGSNTLGGGILLESGSLALTNCLVSRNKATDGGGIAQTGGNLTLIDCTLMTNYAGATGMGLYVQNNSTTTLRRCTLVGNAATSVTSSGGGITHNGQTLVVDRCTFCGNGGTGGNGGGVLNNSGNATITSCTFSGNYSWQGGGVAVMGGTVTLRNNILAGNISISGSAAAPDCFGTIISSGFNLVGNRTNSNGWITPADQLGTTANPINPLLDSLRNNGGLTKTMALLPGSPATDKGHSSGATQDQRGLQRPWDKSLIPNPSNGDGADIGAFEGGPVIQLVTNVASSGPGSLRQAILNGGPEDITQINFAGNLAGQTIGLSDPLVLEKDFIINGPGASLLALSAGGGRAIHVKSGRTSISGLTIRDCYVEATGFVGPEMDGMEAAGAAILNDSDLSLTDCVISNNFVAGGPGGDTTDGYAGLGGNGLGGAIANHFFLSMTRCLLVGNSAFGGPGGYATDGGYDGAGGNGYGGSLYNAGMAHLTNCCICGSLAEGGTGDGGHGPAAGGGIYNYSSTLDLVNCTIASNTASISPCSGGGIYDGSTYGIYRHSTIAGNSAAVGGGLWAAGPNLGNTLVACNDAGSGKDIFGTITSGDFNFIQHANGFFTIGPTTNTVYAQNPLLGPLQDNGGPWPTIALLPGSPAIDRGNSFGIPADQRGHLRPFDFASIPNVAGGDGSDIGAYESDAIFLNIARATSNVILSWATNAPGLYLEGTTDPEVAVSWVPLAGSPIISNGQFTVFDTMQAKRFYRLRSP